MSIQVTISELRSHAKKLDTISDSGQEAVDAGAYVTTSGEAFGVLCSFIGAALLPVQGAGVAAAGAACGLTNALAESVRGVANGFELTDEVVREAFEFMGK